MRTALENFILIFVIRRASVEITKIRLSTYTNLYSDSLSKSTSEIFKIERAKSR